MNKSKDLEMQTPLQSKSQKQPNQEKTQNKQDDYDGYDIRQSSQPLICLLHLLFKFCALFSYLFLGIFLSKAIFRYILIILFQALDFYIVKNITGRFLVGLKWYSDVGANGQVIWKFEYFDLKSRSKVDSSIFWTFQLGFSALWLWFTFYNLITFGIIDIVFALFGANMSCINTWAFYKSSKDQQRKMKEMKSYFAVQGAKFMISNR